MGYGFGHGDRRKDLTANTTTIGAVSGCIQRSTDPAARPLSYDASNPFTAVAEHSGGVLAEVEPELPMSRRSPFLIELSDDERAQLDVGAQTHRGAHSAVRARIVSAADRVEVVPNTVLEWHKRSCEERVAGLAERQRSGRPRTIPPEAVAEVEQLACELPATTGVPLSRWSWAELAREVIERSTVMGISPSTIWRVLHHDAIHPWSHRSWVAPRDPDFAPRQPSCWASVRRPSTARSPAVTTTSSALMTRRAFQARCRCHPTCRRAPLG